jgi:cobalt-zinc-cadmium efflux system protein
MSGDHHHHHGFGDGGHDRAFAIGIALNVGFVAVEAVFGVLSGSLALVADAGHNLFDVLGLMLAWAGSWAARRRPRGRWTYGFGKSTILASLANALLLAAAIGAIAWEAVGRLLSPQEVAGATVAWVAAVGIVINTATAAMFLHGRKEDLNIRGAFLHMAADAAVSAGVVVAALLMMRTGWLWLDPVVSLIIVAVIAVGTWGLLRDSWTLALDAVPAKVDHDAVCRYLAAAPGVVGVHDLHIWPLSTTSVALTAHLVKPNAVLDDALLHTLAADLHKKFGIDHATIQFEGTGDERSCHLVTHVP